MYNTVLVPLDGSKRAETILPHIEDIALRYKAKVIFLSVIEQPHTIVAPDGIYIPHQDVLNKQQEETEEYLHQRQQEFVADGLEAKIRITVGRVVDEVIRIAEEENADLIAMASHGRSGLARVFYGSVAAGVLHRVDRPLLLVRAEKDD